MITAHLHACVPRINNIYVSINWTCFNCRYVKRLIKKFKHKEETEEDVYTRWEKDFDLVPQSNQGLFSEYLELGVFFICVRVCCALIQNEALKLLDNFKASQTLFKPDGQLQS